ncbi:SigE family RNA polymerase sigma factor [Spirillospora sp. NPDC048911]|uniref:SigE family RNA polymerase sigma factor n=1 Tax=Spirillospora sp. NPDC048911 TaxID=3364527 RepID=UPI003716307B
MASTRTTGRPGPSWESAARCYPRPPAGDGGPVELGEGDLGGSSLGEGGGGVGDVGIGAAGTGALPLSSPDEAARAEFHRFFQRHHRELARLAYLMLGDADAADDVTADALAAAWHRWDRVRDADQPLAYVRRMVVNLSSSRIRTLVRERAKFALFGAGLEEHAEGPDVPAVIDVRAALQRLPERKRACVVLRLAFDLSEQETARVLGVSVGTVKSQTSRGVAELERMLRGRHGRAVRDVIADATQEDGPRPEETHDAGGKRDAERTRDPGQTRDTERTRDAEGTLDDEGTRDAGGTRDGVGTRDGADARDGEGERVMPKEDP